VKAYYDALTADSSTPEEMPVHSEARKAAGDNRAESGRKN
jgi:hypothetical protein